MTTLATKDRLVKFQSLLALVIMLIALSIARPESFLTIDNWLTVLRQISINLCISIGMTLVILSGGIDLSVGSVLALSGAVAASLLKDGIPLPYGDLTLQFTTFGAIVAGIAIGSVAGWINGMVITRLRVPPFVATLGMMTIARGLTMRWTENRTITNLGDEVRAIGTGQFLGIPMPVWISAALVALFVLITKRTRFGRYIYAVGGNERASKLSGLNVKQIKLFIYMIGGGLAGVGGLLQAARLNAADPTVGVGYELDSIAAVVIGGTSLSGGRGSVIGTVLGCLIIGVLNDGLNLLGVSPEWQLVVKGVVIIAAVAIDQAGRNND